MTDRQLRKCNAGYGSGAGTLRYEVMPQYSEEPALPLQCCACETLGRIAGPIAKDSASQDYMHFASET